MTIPPAWPSAQRCAPSTTTRAETVPRPRSPTRSAEMERYVVATIVPTPPETKLLVTVGRNEVLKARLGPAANLHPSAAPMLIEAIARWYEQRVYVVISASADVISDDLGLSDGLGYGTRTLHYEVEWVDPR